MANSVEAATATMIRNLEQKTGKTLPQWIAVLGKKQELKHGEIVAHLKQHGLTHGYANLVAHAARGGLATGAEGEGDALIAAQYAGDKSALRPIYDRLAAELRKFGPDVMLSPKKANVSVRRARQFALLQPSTKTRFDVGLNLKGLPPKGRLEASGSFSSMVSHRVRLEGVEEVDRELIGWLRQAYGQAG